MFLFVPFVALFYIALVRDFEPVLHLVVDVVQRSDRNAMRDAIFLNETSSVDQTSRWFHVAECEAHVDASLSRRFDLRKHVIAIERDDV